jgi:type IV pilus assembly protein PilW
MTSGTDVLQIAAGSPVAAGDVLLVADCAAAAIFVASAVSTTGVISHDLAQGNSFGNASLNLQHAFGPDASVYRLVTRTFYVAPSVNKPATSSLWTASTPNYRGTPQPTEVGEGIDAIRLVFGEDTDGDRAANKYVAADAVGNWANVVSVKPQLLLATTSDRMATAPQPYTFDGVQVVPTDMRVRSVLASLITLRNRVP